ncbi:IMP dehydrogenase [Pasteurella multocida]|uniref:IMP dehydrogenase n=1 Tax=Pasteurella multocida TaxID=747 RepID=UPI0009C31E7E|nr:IMP dehydrogenase [Pasteurella multocida]ARA90272.1 hypothetical protein BTV66_11850 [Pasteurella multocida subsp. septica]
MITLKDYQKSEQKPQACKDEFGRLRVGAAVGAGPGNEERIDALVKAGVDVLLIDSSHGHSEGVLQRVRETRAKYPDLPIVAGNVATAEGAIALADAGASAVKGDWSWFNLYNTYCHRWAFHKLQRLPMRQKH